MIFHIVCLISLFNIGIVSGQQIAIHKKSEKIYDKYPQLLSCEEGGEIIKINEKDFPVNWLNDKFFNGINGYEFIWVGNELDRGFLAGSQIFINHKKETIELKLRPIRGNNNGFELLWSAIVYECFNAESHQMFNSLLNDFKSGKIDIDDFVEGQTKAEFEAINKTQIFYSKHWRPFCESKGLKSKPREWFVGAPKTYIGWRESLLKSPGGKSYIDFYYKDAQRRLDFWSAKENK